MWTKMKCEMSEVKWEQSGILIRIGSRYAVHSTHIAHTNNHQSRTDIESHQRANSSGKFAYVRSWLQKKHIVNSHIHLCCTWMNATHVYIQLTINLEHCKNRHKCKMEKKEITNASKKHKLAHVCVCLHANLCVRIEVLLQIFSRCWDPY